jgi:hypothetical protein
MACHICNRVASQMTPTETRHEARARLSHSFFVGVMRTRIVADPTHVTIVIVTLLVEVVGDAGIGEVFVEVCLGEDMGIMVAKVVGTALS